MELLQYRSVRGHAVAHLVEALRYRPEGRGFDSRWCQGLTEPSVYFDRCGIIVLFIYSFIYFHI